MPNYKDDYQIKMPDIEKAAIWVATPSALDSLQGVIANIPALAVDTESDSLYS